MILGSVVNTQVQLSRLGQTGTTAQSLASANSRLGQRLDSTNVKLSAYGQLASAFNSAKSAAGNLAEAASSKTASNGEVVKAAQSFVDAFNQAAKAVNSSRDTTGTKSGALASDIQAKIAGNDLQRSVTAGFSPAELKQAGITLEKNGTLTLDTKALEQSLQAGSPQTKTVLSRLGQQVGSTADRELSSNGNIGRNVNALSSQSKSLASQQSGLEQLSSSVQESLDKQSNLLNYSVSNSVAAYQKVLSI